MNILSFNCQGIRNRIDKQWLLKELCNSNQPDIILLQETWLYPNETVDIQSTLHQFKAVYKSSIDIYSSPNHRGRPHGGLALLWNCNLAVTVNPIETADNRLLAVEVTNSNFEKILIVNCYLPFDDFSNTVKYCLIDTLATVGNLCTSGAYDLVVIGGDLNSDLSRDTAQSTYVQNFFDTLDLKFIQNYFPLDFTRKSSDFRSLSTLDHFLCNEMSRVTGYQAFHRGDNLSDHEAIMVSILWDLDRLVSGRCDLDGGTIQVGSNIVRTNPSTIRPAWDKADLDDVRVFQKNLTACLLTECVPQCADVHCSDVSHLKAVDDALVLLSESIIAAQRHICFPTKKRKHTPFWSAEISPLKQKSLLWHSIWHECGRPTTGIVTSIMRNTRRKYHKAVKQLKSREKSLEMLRMSESSNSRTFWQQCKRISASPSEGAAKTVANCTSSDDIANSFAHHYEVLYNSGPTCPPSAIDVEEAELKTEDMITPAEVSEAVNQLRPNKWDGHYQNLGTSALKHSPAVVFIQLASIFNACLSHGFFPANTLFSRVLPLFKSGKIGRSKIDNYRPISISSIFLKVFDLIVLHRFRAKLNTSDHQFGFKPNMSTSMCTVALKQTAKYFVNRGSTVYGCLLDYSQAFDRVSHSILFNKLRARGIPLVYLRLLVYQYARQVSAVQWNGVLSKPFHASNGVKQGAISSPIFFSIYIDELFDNLSKLNYGCKIGGQFLGVFGYADDLALLCPTINGLRQMLLCIELYSSNHQLIINPAKSQLIAFTSCLIPAPAPLPVCGSLVQWCHEVTHLGHILDSKLSDKAHFAKLIREFYGKANMLIANFSFCLPQVLGTLLNTYCSSYYGIVTCDFNNPGFNRLQIAWNKVSRRLLNLPYNSHRNLLAPLLLIEYPSTHLVSRSRNFHRSIARSNNSIVSHLPYIGLKQVTEIPSLPTPDPTTVTMLAELLCVRKGCLALELISTQDVNSIIHQLATS